MKLIRFGNFIFDMKYIIKIAPFEGRLRFLFEHGEFTVDLHTNEHNESIFKNLLSCISGFLSNEEFIFSIDTFLESRYIAEKIQINEF